MAADTGEVTNDIHLENKFNDFSNKLRNRGVAICLMGNDGSGKTTLAEELSDQFSRSGIPSKRLHIYNWYKHVFITPFILMLNRYIYREVLIFDRSIYDTFAVFFSGRASIAWLLIILNFILKKMSPVFDYRIYLEIPFEETIKRRSDTDSETYNAMIDVYKPISQYHEFTMLNSEKPVLMEVLDQVLMGSHSS